jgi:hypothetical protein
LNITAGFISKASYDYFIKIGNNGGKVNATFLSWDYNPWDPVFNGIGFIFFRSCIFLMFFGNVVFSCYKIIKWRLKRGEFRISIGLICLFLEVACNSIRAIIGIIAPTYNIYSLPNYDMSMSISFCISLITGILVIFFWFDVTIDPFFHKNGKCLGFMKIPTIAFICFLILLEVVTNIARSFIKFDVIMYVLVIYIALYFLIGIFYFIAGWRILAISKDSMVKPKLRSITHRIVWSGVFNILAGISMVLVTSPFTYLPIPFVLCSYLFYVTVFIQSLILISIFSPSGKKADDKCTPSNSTGKDTGGASTQ